MHGLVFTSLVVALLAGSDDAFKLDAVSSGAMKRIGYYAPQRLELTGDRPASLTKLPDGLEAPRYGVLPIAGAPGVVFHVVLDEPAGGPARLLIDSNGNGDLTDDATIEWVGKPQGKDSKYTMYSGTASVEIGEPGAAFPAGLGLYRFDPADPQREQLKNVLLYYRDYAREGKVELGGRSYTVMLVDENASGDFRTQGRAERPDDRAPAFMIDINGNGRFDNRGERFQAGEPFNIRGTTYELAGLTRTAESVRIVKSERTVEEIPLPPEHDVGKTITAFEAPAMDGRTVHFPADYKGKVVMLDFWATWCGPCMAEVPGLVRVYDEFHGKGFEVLGISLDNADAGEKVKQVNADKGMTWAQVYDGQGWKARVAQLYAIDSIPATFLVDGDTGEILAKGGDLRGAALRKTIDEALAKKNRH